MVVLPKSVMVHCGTVHAGLIPDIIDAFPDVKIAGSKVALMYLKGLTNRDFTQNPVKGGDKIDLGKGMQQYCAPVPQLALTYADMVHMPFCTCHSALH